MYQNHEVILRELENLRKEELISQSQREAILEYYAAKEAPTPEIRDRLSLLSRATTTLLAMGVLAIVLAVAFLIGMSWQYMVSSVRVGIVFLVTLSAYTGGIVLRTRYRILKTGDAVLALASIMLALLLFVIASEYNLVTSLGGNETGIFIFSLLSVTYICTTYLVGRAPLSLLYIISVTVLYYFVLRIVLGYSSFNEELWSILFILLGSSYILVAYIHQRLHQIGIASYLYIAGVAIVIVAALIASGIPSREHTWQAITLLGCLASIGFSIPARSKALLVSGIVWTTVYVIQLYFRYFIDVILWPIGLTVIGVALIAGAVMLERNKQHIKQLLAGWS